MFRSGGRFRPQRLAPVYCGDHERSPGQAALVLGRPQRCWRWLRMQRSMSFYDTCVAPRYRNGPTGRRRLTGAEAFELEGMDPCYIDIDGFWLKGADSKGPESVPIAN